MKTYQQLVQACLESKDNPVRELFPWDLEEMLKEKDPLLLDVREPVEFDAVHINNSLNVPRGVLESACERSAEIIAQRGYTPILTPYQTNWHTFHSGIHCSTLRLMAE